MRVDTNTKGHRQWFYFSIKAKTKKTIKLNIYRFKKSYSLFQRGMKPYVKSVKSKQEWKPAGSSVKYLREKQYNKFGVKKDSNYYYLTFKYQFQNEEDQVFFAAGIPYTYTFLHERLALFANRIQQSKAINFQILPAGKSTCGLDINFVKIQHFQTTQNEFTIRKKIIAINARTHSGQASSSWVLDGLLDFITKQQNIVQWMRIYKICFYIIPMLNVDGVIMGNYRTGIIGDDFNRKFNSGRKQLFPEIFYLKKMIINAKKQGNVLAFIDLHGHSILKNSFIYGPSQNQFQHCLLKKLPVYLWHKSKYFKMSSCKFQTQKDKIQTARMYFQLKENLLSFTCQNSLGLYAANYQNFQMTKQDWQHFGASIVQAIKHTVQEQKQNQKKTSITSLITEQYAKQDLRSTDIPQKSNKNSQKGKSFYYSNSTQIHRLSQKQKKTIPSLKCNYDITNSNNKRFQQTLNTFKKVQIKNIQDRKSIRKEITQNLQISKNLDQQINIKQKKKSIVEACNKFPSLTSKQLKSKQQISFLLKTSGKQQRSLVTSFIDRNKTNYGQRKMSYQNSSNIYQHSQISQISQKQIDQLNSQKLEKFEKYEKYEKYEKQQLVQTIQPKRQLNLKQLRTKQKLQLGQKNLNSIEDIKVKFERKTKYRIHHNLSYSKKLTQNKNTEQNDDLSEYLQKQQKKIENIDISFNDIRVQRSLTCDQSYLASQILKARQMKQTERQYLQSDDQKVQGWRNQSLNSSEQNQKFSQNFSEQFNDSLNDQDNESQELNQHEKKYIIQYIRSHQNGRRDKMFDSQSSQNQTDSKQRKSQILTANNTNDLKRRIHGFKQITFKPYLPEQQQNNVDNELKNGITGNNYPTNQKIRKNPHKFKQSVGVIKYKSLSKKFESEQKQQDTGIYITQKKKLNERFSNKKDHRKDPFILLAIKQKFGSNMH